jgi:hypothetical protein
MVDDRPEDTQPSDAGRAKRTPPTIDLEASRVSDEKPNGDESADAGARPGRRSPSSSLVWRSAIAIFLIAAVSGAAAALLVAVVSPGWEPNQGVAPKADPAIAALTSRLADIETKLANVEAKAGRSAPAPAPDPALAARVDGIQKSLAGLRGELAAAQAQSKEVAANLNEVRSTPREAAPSIDLSAVNERLAGLERTARAQSAAIAQENAKPADDLALRRVVVASLLDVSVRQGDSYVAVLAAAKSLAPNPDALKPLEGFAASGVPHATALGRELLTLVPKLSPPSQENTTAAGSGILDRLQAGASRLVRIERAETGGNDRNAIVARVTNAGLRNDIAEARRELNTLAPNERAAAQAWIDKSEARDAALAASHQFATEAMTALAAAPQ